MKRSPDVERLIRESSEAMLRGDTKAVLDTTSKEPGVIMIGSDPNEWWRGHDAIVDALRSEVEDGDTSGEITEVEAYEEGDVAWATMRGAFIDRNGRVAFRGTTVLHREDGQWRVVQSHASIGVPNDQMLHPVLQSHAAHSA